MCLFYLLIAVEDLSEEPEVSPEPEEHKGLSVLNIEPGQSQEPSVQVLHGSEEPAEDPVLAPRAPPTEPVVDELEADQVPAARGPAAGSSASAIKGPQQDISKPGSSDVEPEQINVVTKVEYVTEAPHPVKEDSKDQEGMSTQQVGDQIQFWYRLEVFLAC